jgi:hypothetical protein
VEKYILYRPHVQVQMQIAKMSLYHKICTFTRFSNLYCDHFQFIAFSNTIGIKNVKHARDNYLCSLSQSLENKSKKKYA